MLQYRETLDKYYFIIPGRIEMLRDYGKWIVTNVEMGTKT